jgi:hypothetical protein
MTSDVTSTAKRSDIAPPHYASGSFARLTAHRIPDVSGNVAAPGSTSPSLGSDIDLGSDGRAQNRKPSIWPSSSEYETTMKAPDGLKLRRRLGLNDRIGEIRNTALRLPIEERFHLLQKFQGQITEKLGQEFKARLYDLSGDDSACEFAMFSLDEIDKSDIKLLREGAIFYWYIGYSSGRQGRRRQSFFYFPRDGRMTHEQFEAAYNDLGEMWSILSAGSSPARQ